MKGLILINAYADFPSINRQSARLKEAFAALGVETEICKSDALNNFTDEQGRLVSLWQGYDFCVYLDKDKYLSQMLEASGVRLFNSHAAIENCDDKMLTFLRLAERGIPMPKTYPAPLCYTPQAKISDSFFERLIDALGLPMVVKTCFGSLGKGVYKAENKKALRDLAESLQCQPHLFQEFIKESAGRDIRVIVVGGKCIAAMERRSQTDFRSNIELGGQGFPVALSKDAQDLCERVANVLKLDYCGIDLLASDRGYLVCEVNSNAFFGGIEAVTGVDVAAAYATHVRDEMKKAMK